MTVEEFHKLFQQEIVATLERIKTRYSVSDAAMAAALLASAKKYLSPIFAADHGEPSAEERQAVADYFASLNCDELCLATACAKGDDQAWEDFFKDYRGYLINISRTMTQDGGAAEQLADSTFAELYGVREVEGTRVSKFTFYSGRGSLRGWLRAVVFQLSADSHRQTSRYVQTEEPEDMERLAHAAELQQATPTTEITFIRERYRTAVTEALRNTIAALDERERLLLAYYYYDDLTLKEIGQMFAVHEATVSRWITKVQKRIRKLVEKSLARDHNFNRQEVNEAIALAAEEMDISVQEYLYESADRKTDKAASPGDAVAQN
ncbi:MAG: sigma-70 family RNA polymerase sigma factor [Acidobacteria bacterium]|nr:sigma-70 family RNA polymerase sigma factor [Acidobacteriota bacterium]